VKLTPQKVIVLTIVTTVVCAVLTYFVKAKPVNLEFVTPQSVLPNYTATYPGDTKLSDRIVKSYDLAMILVQSPYMQKNYNALESIRRWARERFEQQPDFLHPTVLPVKETNRDTVFGAFGHNLFAQVHAYAQELVGHVVRARMQSWHDTYAYQTFSRAFFDLFGWDAEAALMLARYENDRARLGVDALLWAIAWTAGIVTGAVYLFRNRKKDFFRAVRMVTAGTWVALALAYLLQAWDTERASSVMSALFAIVTATYLYVPVAFVQHEEAGRKLAKIVFTPNWSALASWLTVSFLAIQVLTWIRHSMPGDAEPITMLIGSITGNFVHDPVHSKRLITGITAGVWLAFTFWAWRQRNKTYEPQPDVETRFNELDAVAPLARIR
jgi:hypothetical protein